MKNIILFHSYVYTVKSVYRKKLRNEKTRVFLKVLETEEKFIFMIKKDEYKFLKKGAIITVHIGNGSCICIEEGEKLPEDGTIYYSEVKTNRRKVDK